MKVVTFNIRCDYGQDDANSFQYRRDLIVKKIRDEKPDIICFQEVLPHVAAWLKKELTEYTIVGCGRGDKLDGEETSIAYKKSRINLLYLDFFWLSPTPRVPGSCYEDQSECPRICTKAVFYDYLSGEKYRFYNTHLDHVGVKAREKGIDQILADMRAEEIYKNVPVVITGDFNAFPDSDELSNIFAEPDLSDATASIQQSFHDYGKVKKLEKIDYIFVSTSLKEGQVKVWDDVADGIYLSDHYPIELELPEIF
ncbi:endonuclease/exonuclease/phosphatase family protein [Blautia liquoris]|uniref:Endonuclease/exonuclease/phosphatase family protein n=1 Tax=Blautia liquoris TaxID=2779518 RepID=A0A7M2RHY7_9FIRM|nr:endonuclease/exonuclease/phosphatase family protein [Blautia liquoris]QOV18982.1 endonuclease/exonuclease/phosphatase family protein [Blautia liquoris]